MKNVIIDLDECSEELKNLILQEWGLIDEVEPPVDPPVDPPLPEPSIVYEDDFTEDRSEGVGRAYNFQGTKPQYKDGFLLCHQKMDQKRSEAALINGSGFGAAQTKWFQKYGCILDEVIFAPVDGSNKRGVNFQTHSPDGNNGGSPMTGVNIDWSDNKFQTRRDGMEKYPDGSNAWEEFLPGTPKPMDLVGKHLRWYHNFFFNPGGRTHNSQEPKPNDKAAGHWAIWLSVDGAEPIKMYEYNGFLGVGDEVKTDHCFYPKIGVYYSSQNVEVFKKVYYFKFQDAYVI